MKKLLSLLFLFTFFFVSEAQTVNSKTFTLAWDYPTNVFPDKFVLRYFTNAGTGGGPLTPIPNLNWTIIATVSGTNRTLTVNIPSANVGWVVLTAETGAMVSDFSNALTVLGSPMLLRFQ